MRTMTAHLTRPGAWRRAAGALLTAAALLAGTAWTAGCTAPDAEVPGPPTGATGTGVPTTSLGESASGLIPPDTGTGTAPAAVTSSGQPGAPSPPRAATLTWLSGPQADTGIQLDTPAGIRWQGPVPGEYAMLTTEGYRWFGPDGSMVGCTAERQCVGVDGQGQVAVTAKPGGPRLVYGADGAFKGRFSADGDRLADPGSVPGLSHALADSGVDVAGLVNAATLGAPFAGGATGDPHIVTAAGVRFTSQSTGQYVARGGDPSHAIQLQFDPMQHRKDVSVVSAVAIGADGTAITVDMDGSLTVGGTVRPRKADFEQITLSSGVAIGRWPADAHRVVAVAVVWPDGGSVVMAANPALGLTVVAHLPPVASAVGIFGAGGLGVGPDLLGRSGVVQDVATALSSWQATRPELLFANTPESHPGFPEQTATVDPAATAVADRACADHGIRQAEDLAACVFDVGLTGDTGFVAGHVALATAAEEGPVAASFAARWPALVAGVVLGAPDLPAGGNLEASLGAAGYRAFRVVLERRGQVGLVNEHGCGEGETPPGMGQAAMRLFDSAGHPVSDRFALCGHQSTPVLPTGVYTLVIANDAAGPAKRVRVDVSLP
jgi:hypothetical protein